MRQKKNNLLYIHIPRTGGTHFEKLLGFKGHSLPAGYLSRCGTVKYGANHEEIMGWDSSVRIMLQHATYGQVVEHDFYDPKENAITVSIIRNPYQRAVSLYKYFGGDKKWGSFVEFLDVDLTDRYFYYSMYDYLCFNRRLYNRGIAIKNLIRFENYKEDAQKFSDENNIGLNVTFNSDERDKKIEMVLNEYYKDEDAIKGVNKLYAIDFDTFNYERL